MQTPPKADGSGDGQAQKRSPSHRSGRRRIVCVAAAGALAATALGVTGWAFKEPTKVSTSTVARAGAADGAVRRPSGNGGALTAKTPTAAARKPSPEKVKPAAAPIPKGPPPRVVRAENEVVRLTNAARARAGCRPLRHDPRLRRAARGHSQNMRNRGFFSHTSPDGRTPWDRIRAAGYPAGAAENIAKGQPGPAAVVRAWMNSPGHRANILNCGLKAIGAGVAFGKGGPWWTQDFGRR